MHHDPNDALYRYIQELLHDIATAMRASERFSDKLDHLQQTLRHTPPVNRSAAGTVPISRINGAKKGHSTSLKKRPQSASSVKLVWEPDDGAQVTIDGKEFHLPFGPGKLLEILVADDGTSKDVFVPWKQRTDVLRQLEKKTGIPRDNHGLSALVHRLREALEVSWELGDKIIQVNPRRHTLRFALLRKPTRRARPRVTA